MGATFCNVHVYSVMPPAQTQYSLESFAENWYTLVSGDEERLNDMKLSDADAKKLSKTLDCPVLWFCCFDEEANFFRIYSGGRLFASFYGDGRQQSKNLTKVSALIGYGDKHKRRLSTILTCSDLDCQTKMLEEYFGVPLDMLDDLQDKKIERGDRYYREYTAQLRAISGVKAAVEILLVQQLPGMLFAEDWERKWIPGEYKYLPHFQRHYYLYTQYRTTDSKWVPAHFAGGRLSFISAEEMRSDGADKSYSGVSVYDSPHYTEQYLPYVLSFGASAPAAYAGKTLRPPCGMAAIGFDAKNRLLLTDERGSIAILDDSMKLIAKLKVKGMIIDQDGDYLLTFEETAPCTGILRVYHFSDK